MINICLEFIELTSPSASFPLAKTNLRPLPLDKHRPPGNKRPRRIWQRLHRRIRVLQDPHGKSGQGRERT